MNFNSLVSLTKSATLFAAPLIKNISSNFTLESFNNISSSTANSLMNFTSNAMSNFNSSTGGNGSGSNGISRELLGALIASFGTCCLIMAAIACCKACDTNTRRR